MMSARTSLRLGWRLFRRSAATAAAPWLLRFGPWLAVVAPVAALAWLIREHQVNFPFLDDWMFTPMYEKVRSGHFEWRDLFVVQMEHRLATVRAVLIGLLWVTPWQWAVQNWITLGLLILTSIHLACLLRRRRGVLPHWTWLLALINIALFSPVLYQIVLWPMMFQVVMPVAALTAALVAVEAGWSLWLRWLVAVVVAVAATLSFASGMLIWPLVALAILGSDAFTSRRERLRLLVPWLVASVVTVGLYFHDLRNGSDPAFSYRAGDGEVTLNRDAHALAENPTRGLRFILLFLGSPLARGTSASMPGLAAVIGAVMLIGLLGFVGLWGLRWRRGVTIGAALPWLLMGVYAVGTAAMASLGRSWASHSGDNALAPRYVIHSIVLIIALIVLGALELARQSRRPGVAPALAKVAVASLTAYVLWQAVAWNHGRLMMGVWESSRLRAATSALFYNLQEEVDTDDWVPRNMGFVRRMNTMGLLRPPLLTDDRLRNFRVEPNPASTSTAAWTALRRLENGSLYAEGYARLPGSRRVADGIFFTQRGADLRDHIVHVAHVSRLPLYLGRAIGRDLRFVHHQGDPLEQTDLSGFETEFELTEPTSAPVVLSAWLFDYRAWSVTLIDRFVYHPGTDRIEGISKRPARNDMVRRKRERGARPPRAAAKPPPPAPDAPAPDAPVPDAPAPDAPAMDPPAPLDPSGTRPDPSGTPAGR